MSKNEHDCGSKHNHHNHDISKISTSKLIFVIIFNFIIALTEIIGGIISGSLSLIADAIHNLSDTISIILSYIAIRVSEKPKNNNNTYGYKRANILSAFVNSAALIGIAVYLMVEAFRKFWSITSIEGTTVIWVAAIGLFGNFFSVLLLKESAKDSINIKSSYLHLVSDTLCSVAVVISGIIIKYTAIYWIDPILTIFINIIILKSSYSILKESINILMQGTPLNIDVDKIKDAILGIGQIKDVHHIHVWRLDERNIILEGHIKLDDMLISETEYFSNTVQACLKEDFGINHVVIQFESTYCKGDTCKI